MPNCKEKTLRRDRMLTLGCALLAGPMFVVGLVAQDTPIGTPGTQVATEETPAAAASTDALRKAAQNPIASLISVPVQNNNNFGIGPDSRVQDVLNIQPVIPARLGEHWNLISHGKRRASVVCVDHRIGPDIGHATDHLNIFLGLAFS
jgi:hypothetical protein